MSRALILFSNTNTQLYANVVGAAIMGLGIIAKVLLISGEAPYLYSSLRRNE